MSDENVIQLVPPPTVEADAQAGVVEVLQQALAEALEGRYESVVLILGRSDDYWLYRMSDPFVQFTPVIGQLEMVKQELIQQFLTDVDSRESQA